MVTDGLQTFAVFTYNSNMLEWSGRSSGPQAAIGFNVGTGIQGNFPSFQNHPLSTLPGVSMIASLNLGRGIEWTDIVYKIGDVSQNELDRNRSICVANYNQDIQEFELPATIRPCPCSLFQALRDRRFVLNFFPNRFDAFFSDRPSVCFYEFLRFPTQECCYSRTSDS